MTPVIVCPGYDTKLSDSEAQLLEIGGMWSPSSLPAIVASNPVIWPQMIVIIKVLSLGQIEIL